VPITTAQLVYHQPAIIHQLMFTLSTNDVAESQRIGQQVRELIGKRHGVAPDDRRAMRIQNNLERFRKMTDVFAWIRVFVWVVGVGTLLAGIVGVGNIMLIAVAERTKEIGIRKAIGATPLSIISMIVCESILLTAIAGYSGLVLGVAAVEAAAHSLKDAPFMREPSVDLRVALQAAAILVGAGVFAGLIPALRAARVDPMVALREGD
jgi:putative ABC transport system permease protein